MKSNFLLLTLSLLTVCFGTGHAAFAEPFANVDSAPHSVVYFTKEISPDSLLRIYERVSQDSGRALGGRVAVKISTGEPGGHHFLNPALIAPLVKRLDGTLVECCTAYGGKRQDPKLHWQAIEDHGFKAIAPCDIMDEFGQFEIPVANGVRLKTNIVGEHLKNYDSMLMLSHFKGHAMGGFGGALKNMSIGIASTAGKANIHTAGKTTDSEQLWANLPEQDAFLESMADACRGVADYLGPTNLLYVNVANHLSVDCDCNGHPATPEMADLGIFASADPVALDQACYDAVKNADDPGKAALIERMDSRHAIHIVEAAAALGLGNRAYRLVTINP